MNNAEVVQSILNRSPKYEVVYVGEIDIEDTFQAFSEGRDPLRKFCVLAQGRYRVDGRYPHVCVPIAEESFANEDPERVASMLRTAIDEQMVSLVA